MDEPVRVCHLAPGLAYGGAEHMLVDIVAELDDFDFVVGYFDGNDDLVSDLERAGADVRHFDETFRFDPRGAARMTRFLSSRRIDVLHTHLPYAQILGRIGSAVSSVGAVVSTKHNVPEDNHPVTWVGDRLTRHLDDVTVAVSNGVEHAFTGSTHPPNEIGDRWCTIYNGIDVDEFRRTVTDANAAEVATESGVDPDTPTVLTVGRYVPVKRQEVAIAAVARLDRPVDLVVVGWGPRESKLRSEARKRGVQDAVHITGRVPSVHPYYALADLFVLPSRREGLPITLLEAMAAGLPVVATDVPGTREAVRAGETGLLYPPGEVATLVDALDLAHDRERRRRYGKAGLARVRDQFSVEQMASTYGRLYRRLGNGWRP